MQGTLEIIYQDTAPITFRVEEAGVPLDVTSYTITCRVSATSNITIAVTKTDASLGLCSMVLSSIPIGVWKADFQLISSTTYTTQQFTIGCASGVF